MENPKKQPVQGTSNTLKQCLQNKDYLKALEKMIRASKNAIKYGCYSAKDE